MPVDLEMILSATNPTIFSYSPFIGDRFSLSNGYHDGDYSTSLSFSRNSFVVGATSGRFGFIRNKSVLPHTNYEVDAELKPINKKISSAESTDGARKKKVSFADDKGLNLVEIREIPSVQKWTDEVLEILINGPQSSRFPEKSWRPAFEHPPWTTDKIVAILDQNNVALQSISIKKDFGDLLNGRIKVKNLAYEKSVFVRITFNRWASYTDVKAEYVRPFERRSARSSKFDTFRFSTKIVPSAMRYEVIEFSVCFLCNGQHFWDNNGGINYRLIADSSKDTSSIYHSDEDAFCDSKITLSLTENIENFAEIDAWSNFIYNQPYW